MAKSGKAKKSGVPVIGEKEYEQYVAFLRRDNGGQEQENSTSSLKNKSTNLETNDGGRG